MLTRPAIVLCSLALALAATRPHSPHTGSRRAAADGSGLADSLVNLEKQSWAAWQHRDGAFFDRFLSEDHVEVGFGGITRKAAVVAGVSSSTCVVHSYAVDHFELTQLAPATAVLTYHAAQETLCAGRPVPSPVWVSSLYVFRAGRWLNAVYQQSQTPK